MKLTASSAGRMDNKVIVKVFRFFQLRYVNLIIIKKYHVISYAWQCNIIKKEACKYNKKIFFFEKEKTIIIFAHCFEHGNVTALNIF